MARVPVAKGVFTWPSDEPRLIGNGEPIGASGLRQVHEVVLQLRGQAGGRQVPGEPKVGYTQLYGAPGVAGVSILSV